MLSATKTTNKRRQTTTDWYRTVTRFVAREVQTLSKLLASVRADLTQVSDGAKSCRVTVTEHRVGGASFMQCCVLVDLLRIFALVAVDCCLRWRGETGQRLPPVCV